MSDGGGFVRYLALRRHAQRFRQPSIDDSLVESGPIAIDLGGDNQEKSTNMKTIRAAALPKALQMTTSAKASTGVVEKRRSEPGDVLAVAIAGALSLAVAMGIGRFAFTPLLPMMLHDGALDLNLGSWLATANYVGYLAGALL